MELFLTCILEEFENLKKINQFASEFCMSLKQRILERRKKCIISVVDFFNDNGTRGHVNQTLDFYDKERVIQEAIMLYNKYIVSEYENIIIGCDINANIKDQKILTFKDKNK